MYLKEFDLDAPDIPERHCFRLQTRCITALYERGFKKFKSNGFWKILVEITQERPRRNIQNALGVMLVQIEKDLASFFVKSNLEKKKLALEFLQEGVLKACEIVALGREPFIAAYQSVVEAGYVNEWTWKKKKSSPSRNLKAEIHWVHDVENIRIFLAIRNRAGAVIRDELLVEESPSEFMFAHYFGSLDWKSENEVVFTGKYGKTSFAVNV
jgi:hypothetical protein